MSDATLIAQKRTETGDGPAKRLRAAGRVPAVVYGLDAGTVSVSVPARELDHILHSESGSNTLISLQVDDGSQLTLARQVHRHPVRGTVLHVDFIRVRADQTIEAEVSIAFIGESEGVRNGGLFEQSLFSLTVEALPGDIPNAFEHDVSALVIGDSIHVRDLVVPPGVVVLQEDDAVVAHISLPASRKSRRRPWRARKAKSRPRVPTPRRRPPKKARSRTPSVRSSDVAAGRAYRHARRPARRRARQSRIRVRSARATTWVPRWCELLARRTRARLRKGKERALVDEVRVAIPGRDAARSRSRFRSRS